MLKKVYTSGEAAGICGLSLSTFKRWVTKGSVRTYRTPGGDIRIMHEQLLEFMKEYDIPLSRLVEEPKVIIYSRSDNKNLINNIYDIYPDMQLFIEKNEMDLGLSLANNKPWAIIFADRDTDISGISRKIKEFMEPDIIKIGIIGDINPGIRNIDSFLPNPENKKELKLFLADLLNIKGESDNVTDVEFSSVKRKIA